ncbi:MAG: hypothetical protein HYZ22_05415 [Chloroflexi bacterium]|nr:hypothetical protein [Chloroflexota bacterium]
MNKKTLYWALGVGVFAILWQVFTFYFRFGQFNPYALWQDYLYFFFAGALGGLVLSLFLNRQTADKAWWAVLIAFAIATPVAMIFMVGGGLYGLVGILLAPLLPWTLITWLGSLVGKWLTKGSNTKNK